MKIWFDPCESDELWDCDYCKYQEHKEWWELEYSVDEVEIDQDDIEEIVDEYLDDILDVIVDKYYDELLEKLEEVKRKKSRVK